MLRIVLLSPEFADPAKRGKARALAGLGAAVTAAVPARWRPITGGPAQETAWGTDAGVQIAPIPVRGSLDAPGELRWNAAALRRLFGDLRPDLVQVEAEPWTPAALTVTAIARRLRVPVVLASRASLPRSLGLVERTRRQRVLRRVAAVLAANSSAAQWITEGRESLRSAIVPAISVTLPPLPAPTERSALSIGFIGRLVPERGLDLLFRACVTLPGPWMIRVVGTGPAQEELEGLAERLGIAAHVTWLGALPRHAIAAVWPTLDCMALPSRSTEHWVDALGRAALEAMAHGLPVVASDSGALPEIVGEGGEIVPEGDVAALTAVLSRWLTDPDRRAHLGTLGRRRVMETYSDSAVARQTLELWRGLLEGAAAGQRAIA